MDKFIVPQHLDEPARIALWTIDEVVIFIIPFLLFLFVIDAPLVGVVISAAMSFSLRKLKGDNGYQYFYQMIYWYLPCGLNLKATPPSYIRTYVG